MNVAHYHLVITGVSLAAGLIATTAARLGWQVLWVVPQSQLKSFPEHIIPCFYHPFKHWGLPEPEWPFDWVLAPINGVVVNQELFQGQGVILDKEKALAGMVADARHLGVEVLFEWADLVWDLPQRQLQDRERKASFDVVLRAAPLPDENHGLAVPTEPIGVLVRALIRQIELPPGYPEIQTDAMGQWLLLPAGQRLTALLYHQSTAENIDMHFQMQLQQRFSHSRFRFPPLRPQPLPGIYWEPVYRDGVIQLSQGNVLGPWELEAEMAVLWARYLLRQLGCYFADQQEPHLQLLNDYAQQLRSWQQAMAKVCDFIYDPVGL